MTLREFVKAFMEANGMPVETKDVTKMIERITDQARKQQKNGCACLSEDDVEKIILGTELKPAEETEAVETEEKQKEPLKIEEIRKPHKVPKPEKKDENQLDIFGMGVDLYG